ncbi:hypothetical protein [Mediterraneibacter gnavus]|uniref:Uncharacterized protein n=1 Tax=Mediterraneibacter gnavus (strain CC55_001C) TaxID=1073375 RepID=A0A829NLL2_MEDG5|nr:hypothetical protein [Mediterraneibacter gnavus]ETD16326.1 hypothetical protein HMPREF1201_02807 [Mediterraneibacter gnavus CC55_001C]
MLGTYYAIADHTILFNVLPLEWHDELSIELGIAKCMMPYGGAGSDVLGETFPAFLGAMGSMTGEEEVRQAAIVDLTYLAEGGTNKKLAAEYYIVIKVG